MSKSNEQTAMYAAKWERTKRELETTQKSLRGAFLLDGNERKKLEKWECYKKCKNKKSEGTIGGRLTYSFTPTGLGVVTIVCCACGNKINLTDFNSW